MYSMGGGEPCRLYLDARVHYVIPGSLIAEDKPKIKVPLLTLQYELDSLGAVSAILGAMQTQKESPEIYIWDTHEPEPEVAVFFRTKKPGKAVLDNMAGKLGATLNKSVLEIGCDQAFTVAEVNLDQSDVMTLIEEYMSCQFLLVDIREYGQPIEGAPVSRFVTRDLIQRRPRFEI